MSRPRRSATFGLWRHPSGIWYVTWTDGVTKRRSTGETRRPAAELWRDQYIARRASAAPTPQPHISTILKGYLADRKGHVRSYNTLEYSCKPLEREFGNLDPTHITNAVVRRYAKKRRTEKRKDGTIIRELVTLRAALKWAQSEGWLAALPVFRMPAKSAPPRERWLTKEEARKLLESARAFHVRLFILLALKTAARRGAIVSLRWAAIDLEARRIDFGRGHGNKRRSVVPIDDALCAALKVAQALACTEWVVELNGERVRSIRKGFANACKRAGLLGVTPNTLRHTAATWGVMERVPLAEVARLLGNSEKMVEKVYGKHSPDYLKRAVTSLSF